MWDYLLLISTTRLVLANVKDVAPGFLSHFPPTVVQSIIEDQDLQSPEQHTLATPIPPAPLVGAQAVAPYVDRYTLSDDVQQVYNDAWKQHEEAQKSSSAFMDAKVPTAIDQYSMSHLYGYPIDPSLRTASSPYTAARHFHGIWTLPVIPAYMPAIPALSHMPQYASYPPAPYISATPSSHVAPENEGQQQPAQPANALYDTLLTGPKMASHIGDSLGSQMGSSLGSTLASDLNLLQGLTNAAAQNFFSVFNGQFQRAQPARLLAGLNDLLALPTVIPPIVTPTIPTATITAKPVAQVWNEAMENLQETATNLSLPTLVGINTSLPVLDTIGAGSELPSISSHTGSNIGSVVGTTLGNTIASTADLWKAMLEAAGTGFMSALTPSISELAGMFDKGSSTSASSATSRRLQDQDSSTTTSKDLANNSASCIEANTLYESPLSVAFNDVPNQKTCSLICQLYSTPAVVTGQMENCYSKNELPCLWTSYSLNSHRCTLLFALANQHQVEGFVSEPVYCPGQTFLQTTSALKSLDASGCNLTAIRSSVMSVVDSAKPPPPKVVKSLLEIPEFPEFSNPDADSQSIWKYNPDTPLNEKGNFEENVIYQIGYGISNPLDNKVWGQASGVKDWRGCLYLCHQDDDCKYWTYHFDPLTYESRYGACVLATNKEPKGEAVSRVKTIAGGRLQTFSTDLFGSVFNDTTTTLNEAHLRRLYVADTNSRSWIPINRPPPRRLSESGSPLLPTIVSRELLQAYGLQDAKYMSTEEPSTESPEATGDCRDYGFAYYIPGVTNSTRLQDTSYSVLASTVDDCDLVCRSTNNCSAFQFIPKKLLSASTTLAAIQTSSCLLLSTLPSTAQIAVPSMVSGLANPTGDAEGCILNEKPIKPTITSLALPTTDDVQQEDQATASFASASSATEESMDASASALSEEATSCEDGSGKSHKFAPGVSIRGRLLGESPNILRGLTTARDCHSACTGYSNCTAFTWGAWQGCYLLQTVEAFVTDSQNQIVSGYADCAENSARDLKAISGKARLLEAETPRTLATCAKAFRGLIYLEGSIIGNKTDIQSADDCWSMCRETPDCYYMTYLSIPSTNATLTTPRQMCVWFDQVTSTQSVQTHLSTSAESNCDVIGDLEFESDWAMSRVMREINIPAVSAAAAGGVAILAGSILMWKKKKSSPLKPDQSKFDKDVTNLSEQNSVNAFGMPGPSLSLSPGAVERGSPALQLDDFEKVEPNAEKSTSKRLRRYF